MWLIANHLFQILWLFSINRHSTLKLFFLILFVFIRLWFKFLLYISVFILILCWWCEYHSLCLKLTYKNRPYLFNVSVIIELQLSYFDNLSCFLHFKVYTDLNVCKFFVYENLEMKYQEDNRNFFQKFCTIS
jgi:hypothetical protein